MKPVWLIFEIVINATQCGFIAYFGAKVFPAKSKYLNTAMYLLPLWLLDCVWQTVFLFYPIPIPNIFTSFMIAIFFTVRFRQGTFVRKFFWLIVFFTLYTSTTLLVRTIALRLPRVTPDFLSDQTEGRIIYVLIVNTVLASFTFILARIAGKHFGDTLDYKVMIVSCALVISDLFVLLILLQLSATIQTNDIGVSLIMSAVSLLIVNTLVLWLFQHISKQNDYVLRLSAEKQKMEIQTKYVKETEQTEFEWMSLVHDAKKRFQTIYHLYLQGQYEALENYITKVAPKFDNLPEQIETGNNLINAVLNHRASLAKSMDIQFVHNVRLTPNLPVDDDDLLIVFENLLENAFEACAGIQKTEERFVSVAAMVYQGYVSITVENIMVNLPKKNGVFSLTSKSNPQAHGIGLRIVDRIAQKYSGYAKSEIQDRKYTMSVLMSLSLQKKNK